MSARRVVGVASIGVLMALGLAATQPPGNAGRGSRRRRDTGGRLPGATEAARPGRGADSPMQIPPRGWLQIGKRVAANISNDRVMTEAAAVTFYALLALFPALAALISLYGMFADPAAIESHIGQMSSLMPGGGLQIITQQVHSLTAAGQSALGLGAIVGVLASIWSANAGVKAMFDALNAVYEEKEKRSFFRRTVISLAFTLGALMFVIIIMGATIVVPAVINFVGFGATGDTVLNIARWPVLLVVIMVALSLLYRFGPSRAMAKWRWISWGSAVATIVWLIGSIAFSYYVANFSSYNKTYGSLGAAVGFMTWIWISTIIVLVGAELNAEMEHQTECDSTVGPPRALGQRGAVKADQVAAA